jgi:hypothetical protein
MVMVWAGSMLSTSRNSALELSSAFVYFLTIHINSPTDFSPGTRNFVLSIRISLLEDTITGTLSGYFSRISGMDMPIYMRQIMI